MMITPFKHVCLSLVAAISVTAMSSGCAKLDSGAHAEP